MAITAARTTSVAYGPAGQRMLLAIMTRSRTDAPNAQSVRPVIGELTSLLMPELLVYALRGKHPIPRSAFRNTFAAQASRACGVGRREDGAIGVGDRDV